MNEVLSEVSLIKDRQEDLDGKLDTMKNENEALWREVSLHEIMTPHFSFSPSPGVEPSPEAHTAAKDCEQVDPVPCGSCPT